MTKRTLKVAIVEDDAAIAQMYKLELETAGFKVETAENGRSGLDLCARLKPDVVLMDLMMPEMNGQEMLKKLRESDWGKDVLVMVLTNLSQREAQMQLGKSGFDEYAVKAYYTPKQILQKVTQLLKDNNKLSDD